MHDFPCLLDQPFFLGFGEVVKKGCDLSLFVWWRGGFFAESKEIPGPLDGERALLVLNKLLGGKVIFKILQLVHEDYLALYNDLYLSLCRAIRQIMINMTIFSCMMTWVVDGAGEKISREIII